MSFYDRRHFLQITSLAIAAWVIGSCSGQQFGGRSSSGRAGGLGSLKVSFVYPGPVGDFSWTFTHEQERQTLQQALGDQVLTRRVENVSDEDAEAVIRLLADDGHHLIFATSFGFVDLAPLNPVIPAPVQEQVATKRQAFESETESSFDGPIGDQQNQERVTANQRLTDDQQLSMDWLVEGVEGEIAT